jgi:hypothetical protein
MVGVPRRCRSLRKSYRRGGGSVGAIGARRHPGARLGEPRVGNGVSAPAGAPDAVIRPRNFKSHHMCVMIAISSTCNLNTRLEHERNVFKGFRKSSPTESGQRPWTPKEVKEILGRYRFVIDLNKVELNCYAEVDEETAWGLDIMRDAAERSEVLVVTFDQARIDWGGSTYISLEGVERETGRSAYGILSYDGNEEAIEQGIKWGGVGTVSFATTAIGHEHFLRVDFLTTNRLLFQDFCIAMQTQAVSHSRPALSFEVAERVYRNTYENLEQVPRRPIPLKSMRLHTRYMFSGGRY